MTTKKGVTEVVTDTQPDPVDAEPVTMNTWASQVPCFECGGRPGYDPATGQELPTGHRYECSQHPR